MASCDQQTQWKQQSFINSNKNTTEIQFLQGMKLETAAEPFFMSESPGLSRIQDKYQIVKVIGQGQHGTVSLVRKNGGITQDPMTQSQSKYKPQSNLFAMKTIPMLNNFQDAQCSLLPHLTHPNIISTIDILKSSPSSISIILQYASQGDLHNYCQTAYPTGPIPEPIILSWLTQIALGLFYLHNERHVIHRDIKKRNVLVMGNGMIKLADFGVARKLDKCQDFARTAVGTPYYISPEAIDLGKYNNKSDVWALGCLMYELCARQRPFQGASIGDLMNSIMRNQIEELPKEYSKWLRDLIKSMLQKNHQKRPTIHSILEMEEIRKQFIILRQKYPIYETISYPEINLRTTKYFQREEKVLTKMKIFTESLKTAKKDKCIRIEMQEQGNKFLKEPMRESTQMSQSLDIRMSSMSSTSKSSIISMQPLQKKKKKVERVKFAQKSLKFLIQRSKLEKSNHAQ